MKCAAVGLCVFAVACAATPTAPTSALDSIGGTNIAAGLTAGSAVTQAHASSDLPFKGDVQATEAVDGSQHHLVGTGDGTQLGRFTYTADITVDDATGDGAGTVTWTAANGDRILASTNGRILVADFPNNRITVGETQIITGGTGRFSGASGTISVERTLDLLTGVTAGSFTGTITLGHSE
jgi:hypothetical protein